MELVVFSASSAFDSYLRGVIDKPLDLYAELQDAPPKPGYIYVLNISSLGDDCLAWLKKYAGDETIVAICSDRPDIHEMLKTVQLGARAYCNSFMQSTHYRQMFDMLDRGQSWFPPQMIEQTFELARQSINGKDKSALMADLTAREKEIALAICEGKSNREISTLLAISEPTVKTHLTNIFKKLQLKDRVALVLYLK